MTNATPRFQLRSVYDDGTEGRAEFYPVSEIPVDTKTSRRGMLALELAMGGGLSACAVQPRMSSYDVRDKQTGTITTMTEPCGTPLPAGATCTCNCIGGGGPYGTVTHTICTCNKVCTCVPVYQ